MRRGRPSAKDIAEAVGEGVDDAAKPTLAEIKAAVKDIHTYLVKEFGDTPALAFVKQKLQEAQTGIEQELRNIQIDAEMEAKKVAQEGSKVYGGI